MQRISTEPDGVFKNGVPLKDGEVDSLERISMMCSLQKLALVKQPLKSISALSGLIQLTEVNLACSAVNSLSGLANLPCLNRLDLSHTEVKDLTPLRDLPNLREVTVTLDMLPLTLDPEARYEVVLAR